MRDTGDERSRIAFLFDAPSQNDVIAGSAMTGTSGLHWLDLFGLTPEEISTSHLIRCYGTPPIMTGSAAHCRVYDTGASPDVYVYTFGLNQGMVMPAYRRLIHADVAKALRLASRGLRPCVCFGRDIFRHMHPHASEVEDDFRRWRGHVWSPNKPLRDWYPQFGNSEFLLRHNMDLTRGPIGIDLEYNPDGTPTVLGLAFYAEDQGYFYGAIPWNPSLVADVVDSGRQLVAYSAFEADKPILDRALGVVTPNEQWEDALQLHFLHNRDLFDVPSNKDDGTSIMFMGLGTAASMVLDVPLWKKCRGRACEGAFCPLHDKLGYCGLDAFAGLAIYHHYTQERSQ